MKIEPRNIWLAAALVVSALLLVFGLSAGFLTDWHPGAATADALRKSTGIVWAAAMLGSGIAWVVLKKRRKATMPVTFTSHYRKVSLAPDQIEFIESLDEFVKVHAADGTVYPTKIPISQWQDQLGPSFLRIHRSFLVNRRSIGAYDGSRIRIGSASLPVSRKYKADVLAARTKCR